MLFEGFETFFDQIRWCPSALLRSLCVLPHLIVTFPWRLAVELFLRAATDWTGWLLDEVSFEIELASLNARRASVPTASANGIRQGGRRFN